MPLSVLGEAGEAVSRDGQSRVLPFFSFFSFCFFDFLFLLAGQAQQNTPSRVMQLKDLETRGEEVM